MEIVAFDHVRYDDKVSVYRYLHKPRFRMNGTVVDSRGEIHTDWHFAHECVGKEWGGI